MQKFDVQEYYQGEIQRKILYVPNLSQYLDRIHQQTLRLPHEMISEGSNEQTGTTYADIVKSITDSVKIVYAILQPIRKLHKRWVRDNSEPMSIKELKNIDDAMEFLGWIYDLLEQADLLNDNLVELSLPDDLDKELDNVEELEEPEEHKDD